MPAREGLHGLQSEKSQKTIMIYSEYRRVLPHPSSFFIFFYAGAPSGASDGAPIQIA